MYRLKKFHNFFALNEQEESSKESTQDFIKAGALSMIKDAFQKTGVGVGDGVESDLDKASEFQAQPYKGCGASAPYGERGIKEMNLVDEGEGIFIGKSRIAAMLHVLNEKKKGDYTRAIKDLKEGKAILIGIRRKFEIRKANDDLFCDFIGVLRERSGDTKKQAIFFPGTTCPSLAYYGAKPLNDKGVGIKAPGDTLYILGEWKPPSPKIPSYVALKEGENVGVYRYPKGTTSYEKGGSYTPGSIMKEATGMHIHRSSTGENQGICVGPWSAGCQVLGKGDDFDSLISICKETGQEKFFYALVQEDDYLEFKKEIDATRDQIQKEQPQVASAKEADTKTSKEQKKA